MSGLASSEQRAQINKFNIQIQFILNTSDKGSFPATRNIKLNNIFVIQLIISFRIYY